MGFLKAILKSKKAGATVIAAAVKILAPIFGLDSETADAVVKVIMTYIASQGAVDLGLALKGSKTE